MGEPQDVFVCPAFPVLELCNKPSQVIRVCLKLSIPFLYGGLVSSAPPSIYKETRLSDLKIKKIKVLIQKHTVNGPVPNHFYFKAYSK